MTEPAPTIRDAPGVPPGMTSAVLDILRAGPVPMRRRAILEALESRGRRLALAGLNRLLESTRAAGLTAESPDGVRLVAGPGATGRR